MKAKKLELRENGIKPINFILMAKRQTIKVLNIIQKRN